MTADAPKKRRPAGYGHGPVVLGRANATRMLDQLQQKAEAGDVAAAEAIVRLSMLRQAPGPAVAAPSPEVA